MIVGYYACVQLRDGSVYRKLKKKRRTANKKIKLWREQGAGIVWVERVRKFSMEDVYVP